MGVINPGGNARILPLPAAQERELEQMAVLIGHYKLLERIGEGANNIIRGPFQNAFLCYCAFLPTRRRTGAVCSAPARGGLRALHGTWSLSVRRSHFEVFRGRCLG